MSFSFDYFIFVYYITGFAVYFLYSAPFLYRESAQDMRQGTDEPRARRNSTHSASFDARGR